MIWKIVTPLKFVANFLLIIIKKKIKSFDFILFIKFLSPHFLLKWPFRETKMAWRKLQMQM